MLEESDLGPADEALLDLLQEGRITAPYAAEEADYSLQYVRDRLNRLVEHGNARKIYEGLYELVEDPRENAETDHIAKSGSSSPEESVEREPDETWEDTVSGDQEMNDLLNAGMDTETDSIEGVLEGWRPGRGGEEREQRRKAGRAALEWLRDYDGRASGGDFKNALYKQHAPDDQGEDTFWRKTARPAVQRAVDADLVEYREGHHDYRWVGDSDE